MTDRKPCHRMPKQEKAHAPCVKCGAMTELEAETKCRPSQDMSGEYECPGDFDEHGRSVVETQASIAAMAAWYEQHADCGGEAGCVAGSSDV